MFFSSSHRHLKVAFCLWWFQEQCPYQKGSFTHPSKSKGLYCHSTTFMFPGLFTRITRATHFALLFERGDLHLCKRVEHASKRLPCFLKFFFSCPVLCGCSVFLLRNAPFISNFFVPAAFFFCWLSVNGIKGAFEEVNHDGVLGANNNQVYHVKIFRHIKECNI